jgi:DNA mismatch repair protein MutL
MPIHLLPPEIASQIAAGEVVERPASVVKELVENALDADARNISVRIEEAGKRLIETRDDGRGIPSKELPLAVSRHATSKLSSAADLFQISTLGFRGEALASIGSVSRMTILSRTAEEDSATRLRVDGGIASAPESVAAPKGTLVRVENLFYNVPARLKFLKTDATERRAIDALMTRYALAYPQVRFRLSHGTQTTLQTAGDGDRRAILAALYGVDTARAMLEVSAEEDSLRLTGFISPVALTRSNRREITFFVNGRWVQDAALVKAVLQAYRTLLMVGRYPIAALFLELPPREVDVNVHPAKAEVRFRDAGAVFAFVQRSTRRALLAYSPAPQMPASPAALWSGGGAAAGRDPAWDFASETTLDSPPSAAPIPQREMQPSLGGMPLLRLVGQIGATYLVAEGPDGLYLIDQHAAHERILFEKLMAQKEARSLSSQNLLQPVVIQLPPAQASLLEEELPILQTLGFEVAPFGPNAFQVRAIPSLFSGSDPAAALRAVVEDFEGDETPLQDEIEAKIAARVCKRMAVKGGQVLSREEQEALLRDLESCESPRTCPHGRPTMIHLSVDMLERQFGRKGAR